MLLAVIVVVSGSIGRLPVGGHAWIDMQYLEGFRRLGLDVYYLEDCGPESWVYDWEADQMTTDLAYPGRYVRDSLAAIGLDRWIYRAGQESVGMGVEEFADVCANADLLLVRAVPLTTWRPEYERIPQRAFVDADPGFTQISLANGDALLRATVDRCQRLFTVGQRLGAPDCPVPLGDRAWVPTLPPVALEHWPVASGASPPNFTTVMQWKGFREVEYGGVRYGQKNVEFPKFYDLPRRTQQRFELALTGASPEEFESRGWDVTLGWAVSRTVESYRAYVQASRGEFAVAKHGYVNMRGGWFSDRSVCYLASGRPVVVQDTGLADWLPIGEGVETFTDIDTAVAAVDRVNASYERHRRGARRLAEEVFSASEVLTRMLEVCGP